MRNPLVLSQIDALTATQTNISLVCTSFSGTSNITAVANWHEQVILWKEPYRITMRTVLR